jgi:hypothetical protein
MNGGIETPRRAAAFMGNVITILGLLVLGYPLPPAALRSLLLGWVLFVVATTQFIWMHFRPTGTCVALSAAPCDRGAVDVIRTVDIHQCCPGENNRG